MLHVRPPGRSPCPGQKKLIEVQFRIILWLGVDMMFVSWIFLSSYICRKFEEKVIPNIFLRLIIKKVGLSDHTECFTIFSVTMYIYCM